MNKIIDLERLNEVLKMITQESGEVEKTFFPYKRRVEHRPEAEVFRNSVLFGCFELKVTVTVIKYS